MKSLIETTLKPTTIWNEIVNYIGGTLLASILRLGSRYYRVSCAFIRPAFTYFGYPTGEDQIGLLFNFYCLEVESTIFILRSATFAQQILSHRASFASNHSHLTLATTILQEYPVYQFSFKKPTSRLSINLLLWKGAGS